MNMKLVCTLGEGFGEQGTKYTRNSNLGGMLQQKGGLDNRDLRVSPSIIRTIKTSSVRWMKRVARMGEKKNVGRGFVGKSEGRRSLIKNMLHGKIILKRILKE